MRTLWKNALALGTMLVSAAAFALDIIGIPGTLDDIQVWKSWLSAITWEDYLWGVLFAAGLVSLIVINFGETIWRRRTRPETTKARAEPQPENHSAAQNAPRPDVLLIEPQHGYSLTWDPPRNLQIISAPRLGEGEQPPLGTRLPVFRIKNLGDAVAQDLTIEWYVRLPTALERTILESERLRPYQPQLKGQLLYFEHRTDSGTQAAGLAYGQISSSKIRFLPPSIDTSTYSFVEIPFDVWASVELYSISSLPKLPLFSSISIELDAAVSWAKPFPSTRKFRVTANVSSTRPGGTGIVMIPIDGKMRPPPEVMADVKFDVQSLG